MTAARYFRILGYLIILTGLFYGVHPHWTLGSLVGVFVTEEHLHIYRATMGLYIAVGTALIFLSKRQEGIKTALLLSTGFLLSLAAGRLLSYIVDGIFPTFAFLATLLEVLLALLGVVVYWLSARTPGDPSLD